MQNFSAFISFKLFHQFALKFQSKEAIKLSIIPKKTEGLDLLRTLDLWRPCRTDALDLKRRRFDRSGRAERRVSVTYEAQEFSSQRRGNRCCQNVDERTDAPEVPQGQKPLELTDKTMRSPGQKGDAHANRIYFLEKSHRWRASVLREAFKQKTPTFRIPVQTWRSEGAAEL